MTIIVIIPNQFSLTFSSLLVASGPFLLPTSLHLPTRKRPPFIIRHAYHFILEPCLRGKYRLERHRASTPSQCPCAVKPIPITATLNSFRFDVQYGTGIALGRMGIANVTLGGITVPE